MDMTGWQQSSRSPTSMQRDQQNAKRLRFDGQHLTRLDERELPLPNFDVAKSENIGFARHLSFSFNKRICRANSLLLQREGIDIAASNVAKHKGSVCWIQPHPPRARRMPILHVVNALSLTSHDMNSKQSPFAA